VSEVFRASAWISRTASAKNVTANTEILEVKDLCKTYGGWIGSRRQVKAVQDVSFSVRKGELLCLLGKNGAGKSTAIKCIVSTIRPTSGTIKVLGSSTAVHKHVGFCPQHNTLWPELSATQHLELFSSLKGLDRSASRDEVTRLLEATTLTEKQGQPAGHYSGGQKRRLR
jgi:ABC-type multidrug transport system ATPase subunit